ncbi:MAG: iron chaperone [Coprobacillus sp.]
MKTFEDYLATISNEEHRYQLKELLDWVKTTFPHLETKVAWNQPMFIDHGTFIIGFSVANKHFSISPEVLGIKKFSKDIENSGYSQSRNLFRIKWTDKIDYDLLKHMIQFNIDDKINCTSFWRS